MKTTLVVTTLLLASTACFAEPTTPKSLILKVPNGTICIINKKTGKIISHGHCISQKANEMIKESNEILAGDLNCANLRKAIGLINAADELYTKVGDVSGEARDVSRTAGWGQSFVDGFCYAKPEKNSDSQEFMVAQNTRSIPPIPKKLLDEERAERKRSEAIERENKELDEKIEKVDPGFKKFQEEELKKFKPIGEK